MARGRVLLLNQSFDVLGTIGVARAIRMTLRKENPVIVHEVAEDPNCGCGEGIRCLRSGSGEYFNVPSVISLKHFVDVRKKRNESGAKRLKIYLRDKYTCQYCSVKAGKTGKSGKIALEVKELTLDHIIPKSKGGTGLANNLVTACKKCNQRKADRTPSQAGMPLRTEIHDIADIGLDRLMICKYVEENPSWLPYLQGREEYADILKEMQMEMAA